MNKNMFRAAELMSLLFAVFAPHVLGVSVADERGFLDIEVVNSASSQAVAVNAAAFVDRTGPENAKLVRSERGDAMSRDATVLKWMEQRRAAREDESVSEFERVLEGKWMPLTSLAVNQSSVSHGGAAKRAIDGVKKNDWGGNSCTHTKYEWKPWWEVHLPHTFRVAAVQVTNRADCCGEQCNICSPLDVEVDDSICQEQVTLKIGESKEIPCPMVGNSIKISMKDEDFLMLCEVMAKGTQQSLLETAAAQCASNSVLVQPIVTPMATDGRCLTEKTQLNHISDDRLQTTAKECEEHLLKSGELVEGAVWQGPQGPPRLASTASLQPVGLCQLLKGRRVVGAEKAEGARCFRKLHCPQDMAYWRKRAGIKGAANP